MKHRKKKPIKKSETVSETGNGRRRLKVLSREHPLSADDLGKLADRLAQSNDLGEIIRLKSAMTRGFYGE